MCTRQPHRGSHRPGSVGPAIKTTIWLHPQTGHRSICHLHRRAVRSWLGSFDQERSLARCRSVFRPRLCRPGKGGAVSSGEGWETKPRYVSCVRHTIALTSIKARGINRISSWSVCQQCSLAGTNGHCSPKSSEGCPRSKCKPLKIESRQLVRLWHLADISGWLGACPLSWVKRT